MSKRSKVRELRQVDETIQKRESPRIRNRASYTYDDDIWEAPQKSTGRKSPSRKSSDLNKSKSKPTEGVDLPRSPGRSRSSGRTKSPARTKTPELANNSYGPKKEKERLKSRSPARSKSTSQLKNVGKDVVAPISSKHGKIGQDNVIAQSEKEPILSNSTSESDDFNGDNFNSPFQPQFTLKSRKSARKWSSTPEPVKEVVSNSTSSYIYKLSRDVRYSKTPEVERVVHPKPKVTLPYVNLVPVDLSDEEERAASCIRRSCSVEPKLLNKEFVVEFGGRLGTLVATILIPLIIIGLNIVCDGTRCEYKVVNWQPYVHVSKYFDLHAFVGYSCFVLLTAVLCALPFGGSKHNMYLMRSGKITYVKNAPTQAVVTLLIFFTLEYYGLPVISSITHKYFELITSALYISVMLSVYLYIASHFVPISEINPNADTNSTIYDFFMGRETFPRMCGRLYVKILLFRVYFIGNMLLHVAFLYEALNLPPFPELVLGKVDLQTLNLTNTMIVISSLSFMYYIDGIVNDERWLTTFEVKYEGVGYMAIVAFLLSPFLVVLVPKYVYRYSVDVALWRLGLGFVQFMFGYLLYRFSNNQKDNFKRNPYSPSVAGLQAIPTTQGNKLLVSGYWGFVQHPNYLGEIIMHLSMLHFVLEAPCALACLVPVSLLVHRAKRLSYHCKSKYGISWERYSQQVKYLLVPKVY